MTLRPLGPSVTLTVRANFETPRRIASRASCSNAMIFAMGRFLVDWLGGQAWEMSRPRENQRGLLQHCQNVVFTHQQVFFAVNFDVLARVAAEQDVVAFFELAFAT